MDITLTDSKLVVDTQRALAAGQFQNFTPLLQLFEEKKVKGVSKRISLKDHFQAAPFYDVCQPKRSIWLCGRQVSKSYNVGFRAILTSGFVDDFPTMIMQPRFDQAQRFNNQILRKFINKCVVADKIIDRVNREGFLTKTFRNGNQLMLDHAFMNPDRVRGASGIATLIIDEVQDFSAEDLPILEAVVAARINDGFIIYTGTPKTSDNLGNTLFKKSSQGHWCVKCSCGKYNIAAPDQQLIKMIGTKGCICAFCGKILNVRSGSFVHAFPSRRNDFVGRHISQVTMPMHCEYPHMWRDLIYRMENSPTKAKFYNEILGIACDESVKLLTLAELLNARNRLDNTLSKALEARKQYYSVAMGVDWAGGGGLGHSHTVISILGKRYGLKGTDCLFMLRLPIGTSPEQEIFTVGSLAKEFNIDFLAHDYTGAGYRAESLLIGRFPWLLSKLFPVTLGFKPYNDLVTAIKSGSRASFLVDKTRCLLLTITALRHRLLTVPNFKGDDDSAVQKDFLALNEEPKETAKGDAYYLINRSSDRADDGAFSVSIAYIALCHTYGEYPTFDHIYDKFTPSAAMCMVLAGPDDQILR